MKTKQDILSRAVVLLCVSDRAFLEIETLGDMTYTCEQRNEQRNRIYNWLKKAGYHRHMTQQELALFEETVGGVRSDKIFGCRFQYEAVAVLLWALTLCDMPNYLCFSENDFHRVLRVGAEHSVDTLMNACQLRSKEEIVMQTEVAMLWHWRAIELNTELPEGETWVGVIRRMFGAEAEEALKYIPHQQRGKQDFLVGKTPAGKLGRLKKTFLKEYSEWRHHAFEWVLGDEPWDEVSTDT